MQPDLTSPTRAARTLGVLRARIVGTAIAGVAIVAYWLGRLAGAW